MASGTTHEPPYVKQPAARSNVPLDLAHLHKLSQITQVLILLGAVCAAWFGLGRPDGAWPRVRLTQASRDEDAV
jgi:hypothetical protein